MKNFFVILYFILFFSLLIPSTYRAQKLEEHADSTLTLEKNSELTFYKLNSENVIENNYNNLSFLKLRMIQNPSLNFANNFLVENFYDNHRTKTNEELLADSKVELRKFINQQLMFKKKRDLGVIGEILGYTNTAATIGLAIYSLIKYKDEYFK
ncbi:MAG: hypothetical protein K9J16_06435 [Melioribacteraceae bacterium]|nr:hypothetical protein [Melioribacteraceae bacterium]MCF8353131.1 hypothetical protein [Melioribacteraceae bacterium]MCF8392723.1 hypothetical protein [Melioribacteraceae bacterium]MCF8418254.1 hypothetical protein [Melioribacteraceae bacterium]